MKIFVSSLISGMEDFRAAAKEAIMQLGYDPVMAEDFGARSLSPQIACLDGLRQSGLVILILGAGYGTKQATGISATHEEYREAKGSRPVLAFVQEGVSRDADQAAFVKEVQTWEGGFFRGGFDTAEKLRRDITRAIHEWQVSATAGPLNFDELRQRTIDAIVQEQQRYHRNRPSLILSVVGGPTHAVLRPSDIEKPQLAEDLLQAALFGSNRIFSTDAGNKKSLEDDSLIIQQDSESRTIKLDSQGGLLFRLNLDQPQGLFALIKERLEQQIVKTLMYTSRGEELRF